MTGARPPGRPASLQHWRHVLFAHWPVDAGLLAARLPAGLCLDTFEGQAWIGVVPFEVRDVRIDGRPALPWLSHFPELNVRTYVTARGRPGVYFFSLDAARLLMVLAARRWYHLPYLHARMRVRVRDGEIRYTSRRIDRHAPPAELAVRYRPEGQARWAAPGSLAEWLTARYALYTADGRGRLLRGDIVHAPWLLQPVEARFPRNTMAAPLGIELEGEPVLAYARGLDVEVWPPRLIRTD
jgi:uncharacterized protein